MSKTLISPGQLLADHLFREVEVIDEPFAKLRYGTEEQQVKGDFKAWTICVAVPRGRLVEEVRVTFWSDVRPQVHEGDRVRFREVVLGAIEGRIYVHAYRVEVLDDDAA